MINGKKILSVITARAGSKGIPCKNYRELMGMPLFLWSVYASLNSQYVDKTVISSNCEGCKEAYLNGLERDNSLYTVSWIERPSEYATSTSINERALIHAVSYSNANFDLNPDIVINLQPTSPCRCGGLLDRCILAYDNGGHDSLLTAKKETPFIWQKVNGKWKYTVDKNGCCNRKMRQQFLEEEFIYHDCGNVFMVDRNILLNKVCRVGDNPCIFEVEGMNSIDIDEEFDFQLIENMAKAYNLKSLI